MKKRLIIVTLCILMIIGIVLNFKPNKDKQINIEKPLKELQLPNGLFLNNKDKETSIEANLYCTAMMNKIKKKVKMATSDDIKIKKGAQDISELQALMNSGIILNDEEKEAYKYLIEGLDYKKIKNTNENYIIDILFIIQALRFSDYYNIDISYKEEFKNIILSELQNINNDDDIVTIYTIFKGANLYDINIDTDVLNGKVKQSFTHYIDNGVENLSDVIELYYISELKSIYNINIILPDEFADMLTGLISCSFDNITIFYDVVNILYNFDKLTTNRLEAIQECIESIDKEYLLSNNCYTIITTKTASLLGTYSALCLVEKYNVQLPKIENIKAYYYKILNKEYILSLSKENALYIYLTCEKLNIVSNDIFLEVINDCLINNKFNFSIRDMYCILELSYKVGGFTEDQEDKMIKKIKNIEKNMQSYDKLSGYELSMLLILYDYSGINIDNYKSLLLEKIENSNNIIEISYICTSLHILYNDDSYNVNQVLNQLKHEEGYYISLDDKRNSLYSSLLGNTLEINLHNKGQIWEKVY